MGTATAQKMEYGEAMRLQNPPEGLDKPGLKCSACVVSCDAIRHELQQVPKWTELKIMEAFEKAVTLLGDQYGFSDAEGHACYVQVSSPSPPPSFSLCLSLFHSLALHVSPASRSARCTTETTACAWQRGKVPVATGLKIRTEFQDQVEALTGEFEEEMLEMYQEDYGWVLVLVLMLIMCPPSAHMPARLLCTADPRYHCLHEQNLSE